MDVVPTPSCTKPASSRDCTDTTLGRTLAVTARLKGGAVEWVCGVGLRASGHHSPAVGALTVPFVVCGAIGTVLRRADSSPAGAAGGAAAAGG